MICWQMWKMCIRDSARKVERDLRDDMFGHLEGLSLRYFNENKTGDLMSKFTNDLNAVRVAVGPAVITSFDATAMMALVPVSYTHLSYMETQQPVKHWRRNGSLYDTGSVCF